MLPLHVTDEGVLLTLALGASEATSRTITARLIGCTPEALTAEDEHSGLLEIANMIGGRLQTSLSARGLAVRIGLPVPVPEAAGARPADSHDHIMLTFAFEKGHPIFTVSVRVKEEAQGGAEVQPAQDPR